MSDTDIDEIVRIAAMDIGEDTLDELVRAMERLPESDHGLLVVARKLLAGQKYQLVTDRPADDVDRARTLALAEAIGAVVDISQTDDGMTRITFTPAARQ